MSESTIFGWVIVCGVIFWIFKIIRSGYKEGVNGTQKHCMTCGVDADPKTEVKGSTLIELILWVCFLIPGLIYSIWRKSNQQDICSSCGSRAVVPYDAPAAVAHRKSIAP